MRPGEYRALNAILIALAACPAGIWMKPAYGTGDAGQTNRTAPPVYASSTECASCHSEVATTYARTGMAHSLSRAGQEVGEASAPSEGTYYHSASRTWFSMERRDGKLFQNRWQQGAGEERINPSSDQVDYVVGSGNHARTYLRRNADGTLTELPLAWYAENGGGWAMNPGFDNPAPPTRHKISYGCMFCHDAYPQIPADPGDPIAHPVYVGDLPYGIDCQRCHGPGASHIQAARDPQASLSTVRSAIVNPARLNGEGQMEVCMQCHLEITSFHLPDRIRRFDRGPFDYRSGEPLAGFFQYFQRDLKDKPDPFFGIDSAPYRLRQSKCFQRSSGALTCQRCHDPHRPHQTVEAERAYVDTCLGCHASKLAALVSADKHPRETDCIGCHMPKRRTDDVVHVVVTDHLIQRFAPPQTLLVAPKIEFTETTANSYRGEVEPYRLGTLVAADDDLYAAAAQLMNDSNSDRGIDQLANLITGRHPAQSEFSIELGDALHRGGKPQQAIAAYREAVQTDPHSLRARRSLGATLEEIGNLDEALKELSKALDQYPRESLLWYEVGRIHSRQGRTAQAIHDFSTATKFDPEFAEAYNDLGIALAQNGDLRSAETAFRKSLRIAPYDAAASRNLQTVLAAHARTKQ